MSITLTLPKEDEGDMMAWTIWSTFKLLMALDQRKADEALDECIKERIKATTTPGVST